MSPGGLFEIGVQGMFRIGSQTIWNAVIVVLQPGFFLISNHV